MSEQIIFPVCTTVSTGCDANLYGSIFVYTIKDFLEFSAVSSLDFLHNIFKSLPT